MRTLAGPVAALLLAMACGHACAQSASFGLSLRVVAQDAPSEAPVTLPRPPQAQELPPGRHASRLLFGGSADDARRFYESALPDLGFQLTRRHPDGAVWERGNVRAEVRFQPVAGVREVTGILVTLCSLAGAPGAVDESAPAACGA
jgi:hypothetical protein